MEKERQNEDPREGDLLVEETAPATCIVLGRVALVDPMGFMQTSWGAVRIAADYRNSEGRATLGDVSGWRVSCCFGGAHDAAVERAFHFARELIGTREDSGRVMAEFTPFMTAVMEHYNVRCTLGKLQKVVLRKVASISLHFGEGDGLVTCRLQFDAPEDVEGNMFEALVWSAETRTWFALERGTGWMLPATHVAAMP